MSSEIFKDNKSNKKIIIKNIDKKRHGNFKLEYFSEYFNITKYDIVDIYFNAKGTNLVKNNLDSKCDNFSIIFKGTWLSLNPRKKIWVISVNSLGTKYTNYIPISDDKFNYISNKYIKYNDSITYDKDGIILIYLNNSKGWFKNYTNIFKLEDIIKKIRKYVSNRIIVRLHKKDFINKKIIDYIDSLSKFDVKLDMQRTRWNELIKNMYCIFIQNSSIIFELLSYGIPIFSLKEIVSLNLYEAVYFPTEYLKDPSKYEFDRKTILKRYYSHILFEGHNAQIKSNFITELYKKYY